MSEINYIKENYKKLMVITILAIITSVVTCIFLWPDATPVMADNTDTYGLVQELVREEVENYISQKEDILTEEDISELKKRVDDVLNENGLILKTVYQSEELQKIIKECIEKTVAGDRDSAKETAEQVVSLLKRIEENDRAYQELISTYNTYRTEMTENISILKEELTRINGDKADKEGVTKDLEHLEKDIETLTILRERFEKETEKRIAGLDTSILTNRSDFDQFISNYNEYKTNIKELLDTKATKEDIESLLAKADALEKGLMASIEENTNSINENRNSIEENKNNIDANGKSIDENKNSIGENRKSIEENEKAIADLSSSLSGKKIWVGTQAEYNSISKDADTLYFIK